MLFPRKLPASYMVTQQWEIASHKKLVNYAYNAISALVFIAIPVVFQ